MTIVSKDFAKAKGWFNYNNKKKKCDCCCCNKIIATNIPKDKLDK